MELGWLPQPFPALGDSLDKVFSGIEVAKPLPQGPTGLQRAALATRKQGMDRSANICPGVEGGGMVDVLFTWGGAVAASPSRCMQSLAGPLTRPCSGFTLETHRQLGIVFLLSTHTRGAGLGHLSRVLCGGPHCNVSQEKATWEWALEWGWTQN